MQATLIRSVAAALGVLAIAACQRTGSIEGDVYYADKDGTTHKAPGVTVYLLRGGDSVLASAQAVCRPFNDLESRMRSRTSAIKLPPTEELARKSGALDEYLRRFHEQEDSIKAAKPAAYRRADSTFRVRILDSAKTHLDAHFTFPHVAPGRYGLWSEYDVGDRYESWITQASVASGAHVIADLDAQAAIGELVHCFIKPRESY